MALSLSGERSVVAATPINPVALVARWIGKVQAQRARKAALLNLLDLDPSRLSDLGIRRSDILAALSGQAMARGLSLNAVRARNARR